MASLHGLSPRDRNITTLRKRIANLQPDRLKAFTEEIVRSYEAATIVGQTGRVAEVMGRIPLGFTIIRKTETRSLADFNDESFYWDLYCSDLGRAVALGEELYLFESLAEVISPSERRIAGGDPHFDMLFEEMGELRAQGHKPDVVCAPISVMVPFLRQLRSHIRWGSHPREVLVVPTGEMLRVFWSSKNRPLDRFLIFDSSSAVWSVRPDPESGHRLTVAIGEAQEDSDSVVWLAETAVKYEMMDPTAFRSIPLEGSVQQNEQGE